MVMSMRYVSSVVVALLAASPRLECRSWPDVSVPPSIATTHASTIPALLAGFDALASGPFPFGMDFRSSEAGSGGDRHARLTVISRLRNSVTFPGEPPALLYKAVFDGHAAVVTRSGTGLDISVVDQDGVHVTTVSANDPVVGHTDFPGRPTDEGRSSRSGAAGFEGDVEYPREPDEPAPLADPGAPLTIRIFLHDELRSSEVRRIHAGYVAWWLSDMGSNVLPTETIDVLYVLSAPGTSDQAYGTPEFLTTWSTAVEAYARTRDIRRTWKNKYLLLTRRNPAQDKLGQAMPERGVAIAALSAPYNVVAHELGHLFGAEHARAEWRTQGWWPCVTNMFTPDLPLLRNCYEYSSANIGNIRNYVELKGYIPPYWLGRAAAAGDPDASR